MGDSEVRNATLIRVLSLRLRIAEAAQMPTLRQLSREFGVCPRTVRRDLESLEDAGEVLPPWRKRERELAA